ncbi:M48 family metalloprotease [Aliiroseovarius sp.]|uniref:M48 family metalloprotease n=1 Tax=Aliiroseovarius sp. TaxID=1872442 RepID=UPI0026192ECD|nr:M48 family metalloprotease [Aliiroseovarius sp.]
MHRFAVILFGLILAACTPEDPGGQLAPTETRFSPDVAMRLFPNDRGIARYADIVARMEPVIERECRARAPRSKCDYRISVETHPDAPSNAFQGENRRGQPTISFTRKLLAELRNDHEIAFILAHEAAHHIRGHLPVKVEAMRIGWLAGEVAATVAGASEEQRRQAATLGGMIAISGFSKEFELEADALGAVITEISGYDALTGAQYFRRMRDPGHRYLGTHPPNAQRLQTVRRTVAGM